MNKQEVIIKEIIELENLLKEKRIELIYEKLGKADSIILTAIKKVTGFGYEDFTQRIKKPKVVDALRMYGVLIGEYNLSNEDVGLITKRKRISTLISRNKHKDLICVDMEYKAKFKNVLQLIA